MEMQTIDLTSNTVSELMDGFDTVIKNNNQTPDKAFEIFKSLVPDLWAKYNDLPQSEFEDVVEDAVKFSTIAALGFKHYSLQETLFHHFYAEKTSSS